jgi:hypothetical protein
MANETGGLSPVWEKLRVSATVISAVLIPVVVAIIGYYVNTAIKGDELSLKYVELAVSVLQDTPRDETENLRNWAIDIINNYSDVRLSEDAKLELRRTPIAELESDARNAKVWESLGFDALLKRDIDAAIEAFKAAEAAWPTYHNVAEIRALLVDRKHRLDDPTSEAWQDVYKSILTSFSWGMPGNVHEKLETHTREAPELDVDLGE